MESRTDSTRVGPHAGDVLERRGGGEAFDAAVGRAPGVLADRAAERPRLRRDVTRRSPSTAAAPPVQRLLQRRDSTHSHGALKGTPAPSRGF